MEDLLKRVIESEKTKQVWRHKHNSIEFKEASKLNEILFGKRLNSSPRCECIEDLFLMVKRPNIHQKIINKMTKKFKVAKGRLIQSHGCEHVSEHSSDEVCIAHLKKRPENIVLFDVHPENWEEIVEAYEPRKPGEPEREEEAEVEEEVLEPAKGTEEDPIDPEEAEVEEEEEVSKMNKAELKAELKEAKVEFDKAANKDVLIDLVRANRNNV